MAKPGREFMDWPCYRELIDPFIGTINMATPRSTAALLRAEFISTALMLTAGLSCVIVFWGAGSPMLRFIPSAPLRRAITSFLFGSSGCLVSLSPVGVLLVVGVFRLLSLHLYFRLKSARVCYHNLPTRPDLMTQEPGVDGWIPLYNCRFIPTR